MTDEVHQALRTGSRTATEVRDVLRSAGRVSVTTADVIRALVSAPTRFVSDGGDPARWRLGTSKVGVLPQRDAASGLYAWQVDALTAWRQQARRGVIEAVTGTGKTRVGVAAIAAELDAGGQAVVLVPTRELLHQWQRTLAATLPPAVRVGMLGDGNDGDLAVDDVLVSVINSARDPLRPRRPGGLLVGDECHRYASAGNRLALAAAFPHRLGLTATFERTDEGHTEWLTPYFGKTCFRMGYARAIADGVVARFALALVGVRFTTDERACYDTLSDEMAGCRAQLIRRGLVRGGPPGAFFADVGGLARGDGPAASLARAFLRAMQERRQLLAETPTKSTALRDLAGPLHASRRALVFTQTIDAAERAAEEVRGLGLDAAAIHSGLGREERHAVLAQLTAGTLRVATAPQVLDEGIDLPAADLAVVLAASLSRRQMIQRMGRVLRRKPDGRLARFVVLYVEGTVEDPALGAHEGFLEEVTAVAERQQRFPSGADSAKIAAFLGG